MDSDFSPVEQFGEMVESYPTPAPKIKHGGDEAFYAPGNDVVALPQPEQFPTTPNYYAAFGHELTHSTGHPKRLDRELVTVEMAPESYSREELVAEVGSAMLLAEAGIEPLYDLTASYVDHWRSALSDDPRLIVVRGGGWRSASCDFITGERATTTKED